MSDNDKPSNAGELSPSGQPILRHGEKTSWRAAEGESHTEEISRHIERHLGSISGVFHEIVSDAVHIDVHIVAPSEDFPVIRMVTSGMSDLPMTTPPGPDIPRYLELMISLPGYWKTDQESFKDEAWYWPLRLLKFLARLPHQYATWLGFGHTIPNGDPPQPYVPGVRFDGAVILPSVSVPEGFHQLFIDADKTIQFLSVLPLYPEEMDLKLRQGIEAVLDRFGKRAVNDIVDLDRVNTAKKRLGFF
ncbi:MAG: suppressor of fused domain protein [Xanthomonadaceae bacterium]|jgi:hypothetical protein|nr:suppressor of fused domain protein [Xanthomonadaceae bacterium]